MKTTPLLSITGRVLEMTRSYIPHIDIAKIVSRDGSVTITMDVHKDIKVFSEGDTVELTLFIKEPEYDYGKDFCAKAVIVALGDVDERNTKITLSMGGLLLVIQGDKKIVKKDVFKPLMELYVRVKKIK